jgi:hypothetical protein
MTSPSTSPFIEAYTGKLTSILSWDELAVYWQTLKEQNNKNWYIYAVGETPPEQPVSAVDFSQFIDEVDLLLRKEHKEDYCGIVFVDKKDSPGMIKIYDPNNLGVVCGFSNNPPPPSWVLSRFKPVAIEKNGVTPANHKRWWQRLFAT